MHRCDNDIEWRSRLGGLVRLSYVVMTLGLVEWIVAVLRNWKLPDNSPTLMNFQCAKFPSVSALWLSYGPTMKLTASFLVPRVFLPRSAPEWRQARHLNRCPTASRPTMCSNASCSDPAIQTIQVECFLRRLKTYLMGFKTYLLGFFFIRAVWRILSTVRIRFFGGWNVLLFRRLALFIGNFRLRLCKLWYSVK